MTVLVRACNEVEVPIHTKCIEILCHLSRGSTNILRLIESEGALSTLQRISENSGKAEDRLFALRAAQNISCESNGRQALAASSFAYILPQLVHRSNSIEEQTAAVSTVLNLCIDSESVLLIATKPNMIAVLTHLCTHESELIRDIACDTLAIVSFWLQKFASKGIVPAEMDAQSLPTENVYAWDFFLSGI